MTIVKVQERKKEDKIVTIPSCMYQVLGDAEYLKCTIDETGIHYSPIK
jgi:hypothetical protein